MNFWQFIQKANSEDNGNPSQRRANVFLACTLFTLAMTVGYFTVLIYYKEFIMEFTLAFLAWITTALGLGIVAKTKEQKVSADELQGLRAQEIETKKVDASIEADKTAAEKAAP